MAHQVDHQGASRASTSTTRSRACATASSATSGSRTSATTSSAASCGTPSPRDERPVLLIDEIDKADIEFPNDLLLELDRMEFYVYETQEVIKARPAAGRDDHLQQREGAARRLPAPLLLPLHPLSRSRDHDADRRRPFPRHQAATCVREALQHLLRHPRGAGPEEEALDLRAARLAEAPDGRGHAARGAARSAIQASSSRRCTARCSRTSRTCTCSSGWPSWRGGSSASSTKGEPRCSRTSSSSCVRPRCRSPSRSTWR